MNSQFPDWSDFLFEPMRYKVAFGGRGSGKSWAFAKALLVIASRKPTRIICTREVQKSIKESVKRLLDDQIQAMGMGDFYQSLETEIRGANGSFISFAGLASHTVESVKSLEGYDIVWIEEAQTVSKKSLDILTPTIRKENSEIWLTFNPELDTDEVWKRFIENTPSNCIAQQVNYSDNPWFPKVLEDERIHCKATAPEDYETIWEGKCRAAVVGAIYAREVQQALIEERIRPIPYDPRLKVHSVWDLGWADSMAIILVQKGVTELRVIGYIEENQQTLDWYAHELNKLPYNWGYDYLPHDGNTRDFKTGKSTAEILASFGRKTRITPNIGIESGIKMARMVFSRLYFDKMKTQRLLECLKRYRRNIPSTTGEPGAPIHDASSHGADAFRYLAVVADQLKNDADEKIVPRQRKFNPPSRSVGMLG